MRFAAWFALFLSLTLWSGNWIVARAVREDIASGFATVGRLVVVVAILVPLHWRALRETLPRLGARDWKILAALGLSGGGPHLAMQWQGLHYTTATNGILYLSTVPIFILLLAPALLGERIRLSQWAGVLISACGIVLIAVHGSFERLLALRFNVGDLFALGSMAMWACYTLLLRMRRDPLEVGPLLAVVCTLGILYMLPWIAFEALTGANMRLNRDGSLAILYSAIGSMIVAYTAWSYVVTRLGAPRAGATLHLMPAIGVGLAAAFLGEYAQGFHFAGIALILAGVALSAFRGPRGAA